MFSKWINFSKNFNEQMSYIASITHIEMLNKTQLRWIINFHAKSKKIQFKQIHNKKLMNYSFGLLYKYYIPELVSGKKMEQNVNSSQI